MKKIILLNLFMCLSFLNILNAQDTTKSKEQQHKQLLDIKKDCCCEDSEPCFKDDKNVITIPEKDYTFIIDFKSKKIGYPANYRDIKKKDFVRVKVVNYNPYLYKVVVEGKDSSVVQPNDSGFLGALLSPDKLTSLIAGLGGLPDASPGVSNANPTLLESTAPLLSNKVKLLKDGCDLAQPLPANFETKKDSLEWVSKVLNCYIEIVGNRKIKILDLRNNIEKTLYENAKELLVQLKLYPDCESFKKFGEKEFISKVETDIQAHQTSINTLVKATGDEYKKFKISLSPFGGFIERENSLKVPATLIDSFYRTGIKELTEMADSIDNKHLLELIKNFVRTAQNSSCYTSLPIYLYEDIKKINVDIKPVDVNSILPPYQTNFPIPGTLRTIWGVSSGVFISGLHNDLYTNKRKEGTTDTLYNLVSDDQGKLQVGVNALAYLGWLLKENHYLGISFGAGMSIENKPKPRILFGLSYIIGEKSRVVISAGFVGGYVSRLSSAYSTTTDYTAPATNYQKDYLKGNGFLSINYSLFNK